MAELDKETKEILSDGEKIKLMVEGDAWSIVRKKMLNQIMDLQSVRNVEIASNPAEILIDIKARLVVIDTLLNFLREIEGMAEQYDSNKDILQEYTEEFIKKY